MTLETRRSGGLGRGLAALIPPPDRADAVRELALRSITPNPEQPRTRFDEQELAGLVESINEHGVIQPVLVMEGARAGTYVLIAGERRVRAAALAGLSTVPAIIRTADQQERLALALVENIQRSELNAMEEARAFQRLVDEFGLTQEQVARQVGRSRPAITNTLRLLDVAPDVQAAVEEGAISGGHARALAGLPDHAAQSMVLSVIVSRGMSVRDTERLVASWRDEDPASAHVDRPAVDADVERMEAGLREVLGTRVTVTPLTRGGRITITWFDDDDLGRLYERLTGGLG